MKKILRILLFVVAIGFGGLLGYFLLSDADLTKTIIFYLLCFVLGYLFHSIDKKLSS